ncbi:helix-turn-helix domain-containing protein [Streptomyces sp. NPDC055103]
MGRELWADVRLRAAWVRGDWGALLREYRRAAGGMTQVELERLTGLPQPHISAIESGRRQVKTAEVQDRIVQALQVPHELTGATERAVDEWAPSADLAARLAHAHATGRVDLRTADRIGKVLAQHRRDEDADSGTPLWPVVQSQLDTVTRLLPDTSGNTADRLLLLAAEHAHWLSWVAWTEQQHGSARSWLDLAHGWAVDGGHADMASWVLRVRSYYTLKLGDPVRALRTAEAARGASGLSPGAASAATQQVAIAAAAVGERDRARRLADEALALALRVPNEADRPGWLYFLNEARARLHAATVAYACRDWAAAADGFRDALPGLEGFPRDHAHYAARLADAEQRS